MKISQTLEKESIGGLDGTVLRDEEMPKGRLRREDG